MRCPNCSHLNIPGVDLCEHCGSDLAGLDLPEAGRGSHGRLLTDRIGDLMLTPAILVDAEDTVESAVRLMRRARHGCVLVLSDNALVGIFTERDLLTRVLRPLRGLGEVTVGEVMTPRPSVLEPHDPPAYAVHRMVVQGIRHLPVLDEGRVLGFISVRNLLRYLSEDVLRLAT